jgi:hypothetical protein
MKTTPLHLSFTAPFTAAMIAALSACALLTATLHAAPHTINYQGKVLVGTTPFSGTGQFRFALINTTTGATVWSNDGTSVAGSQPTAAVNLTVTNGLYSVPLGDSTLAGMSQQITAAAIPDNNIALRVWFNNGVLGSQLLTPDQPIAAVAWAQRAAMASAVAPASINASMLAPASVGPSTLNASGTPVAGQILSFDGTNLSWSAPGGSSATGWTLLGNAPSLTTNFSALQTPWIWPSEPITLKASASEARIGISSSPACQLASVS